MRRQKIRTAVAKGADPHRLQQCWPWAVLLWFWRSKKPEGSICYSNRDKVQLHLSVSSMLPDVIGWWRLKKLLLHDSLALCDCRAGLVTYTKAEPQLQQWGSQRKDCHHPYKFQILSRDCCRPMNMHFEAGEYHLSSLVSDILLKCLNQDLSLEP